MNVATILKHKGDEVVTVTPTTTLQATAELLTRRRIGSVLVVQGSDHGLSDFPEYLHSVLEFAGIA